MRWGLCIWVLSYAIGQRVTVICSRVCPGGAWKRHAQRTWDKIHFSLVSYERQKHGKDWKQGFRKVDADLFCSSLISTLEGTATPLTSIGLAIKSEVGRTSWLRQCHLCLQTLKGELTSPHPASPTPQAECTNMNQALLALGSSAS